MPIHLRNLKKYLHNITPFSPIVLLISLLVVSVLLYSSPASGGPYLDSAHGNTSYGVNRPRTAGFGYARGNCAHCHEKHASIGGEEITPYGYELFYDHWIGQTDLFCYQCHKNGGAEMTVSNPPYCVNFGGRTSYWAYIWPQFCGAYAKYVNCGSRHHLGKIRAVIANDAYGWGFNSDPNPCSACHNPHVAQRSHPVADVSGGGKLNVAIRLPSHYKSTDPQDFLWGDDDGVDERMDEYAASVGGTYQAPYYTDTTSGRYEPAGDGTQDGSNLPDYVTFCMDCHQNAQYDPERSKDVKAIDWSSTGDRHGAYPANTCTSWMQDEGELRAPYYVAPDNSSHNYVLSCLDCHEPHGTYKRLHLIRRMINGEEVAADNPTCDQIADWEQICERCHVLEHPGNACSGCHWHGATDGAGAVGTGCRSKPIF